MLYDLSATNLINVQWINKLELYFITILKYSFSWFSLMGFVLFRL